MNKERRERIAKAHAELQACLDEEEEAYNNMPEGLKSGERGTESEAAVEALQTAVNALEEMP